MHLRVRQAVAGGVALAIGVSALGGAAQAHDYRYRGEYAPRAHVPYGPADPCARQAAQRRLGWGIVGLLAGGLAGGAAAGAGVVAEGAGLGGLVGALAGGGVAAKGAKTEGALLGGAVGAVAGHEIGKRNAKCDRYRPAPRATYRNNNVQRSNYAASSNCRWVKDSYNGRTQSFQVCRDRDGVWRPRG